MLAAAQFGSSWTIFLLHTVLALLASRSHGLDISYCSPENNAGSYQGVYNQFQSNGACQEQCQGSFAFAVLQGYYCWCSNYVPADQESTYNCNQKCPGFGADWCGSTDAGLYGYYLLSAGVPLGTSGSASNTPSSTSSPSVSNTLTASGSPSPTTDPWTTSSPSLSSVVTFGSSQSSDEASFVTYSSEASTTSTSSTTESTSVHSTAPSTSAPVTTTPPTSSPSPTPTPTPSEIYTSVTTVTGEVRTVVVTPSPSTDATLGQSATGGGGGGVSTGKVVGIVVGVALGIGSLIGFGIWWWIRRRHRKRELPAGPEATFVPRTGDTSPSNNVPSRQVSQLSSSNLLGNKTPRINTSGVTLGTDPRSAETASSGFDRRSLGTDQRLNPYALYIHDESRLSNVSLQDNQDYSRQLRVANPDP